MIRKCLRGEKDPGFLPKAERFCLVPETRSDRGRQTEEVPRSRVWTVRYSSVDCSEHCGSPTLGVSLAPLRMLFPFEHVRRLDLARKGRHPESGDVAVTMSTKSLSASFAEWHAIWYRDSESRDRSSPDAAGAVDGVASTQADCSESVHVPRLVTTGLHVDLPVDLQYMQHSKMYMYFADRFSYRKTKGNGREKSKKNAIDRYVQPRNKRN